MIAGPETMRASRGGGILLEIMLAVGLFAAAALSLLRIIADAGEGLARASDEQIAEDLAISAIAQIEAGLATPASLIGPVGDAHDSALGGPTASDNLAGDLADPNAPGFDAAAGARAEPDAPAFGSGWTLAVETEPTEFPGLSLVSVTVSRDNAAPAPAIGDGPAGVLTLRQLVRLGDLEAQDVENELLDAAQAGQERIDLRRRPGSGSSAPGAAP